MIDFIIGAGAMLLFLGILDWLDGWVERGKENEE